MKNKALLVAAAACFTYTANHAQTPIAGGDMENWHDYSVGLTTQLDLTAPDGWYGVDSLIKAIQPLAGVGGINITASQMLFKSSDAHEGDFSAELKSKDCGQIGVIPGMVSNSPIGFDLATALNNSADILEAFTYPGGTAISGKVEKVNAWVKVQASNEDSAAVLAMAVKTIRNADDDADSSQVLGRGYLLIGNDVTAYTEVEVELDYPAATADETPDRLVVIFLSSDMDKDSATVDNSMNVDGVTYTMAETGIKQPLFRANNVSVYPNPAQGMVNFRLNANEKAEDYKLTILDINGRVLSSEMLNANEISKDISGFAGGTYFFTVTNVKTNVSESGKFAVK